MMRWNLTAALLLLLPCLLLGKGETTLITIEDGAGTIKIPDANILRRFNVWDGAGATINGVPDMDGFVANWREGTVAAPRSELVRQTASFHVSTDPSRKYLIYYVFDCATRQGFVYLPGRGEPFYSSNTFLMRRTVSGDEYDGNWFQATGDWVAAVEAARANRQ